jgi:hypothetical protein
MSWFRWSGEGFEFNKGRYGMGMKSDGVVMKGKGDGILPPKMKYFFILGQI